MVQDGRGIDRLLRPRSVAVVGASSEPFSLGANVMANFETFGYTGNLYPVSRRFETINGIPCRKSISELPDGIDLAALVVPAAAVRQAIEECAAKGIGSAVIFASGFAELGERAWPSRRRSPALPVQPGWLCSDRTAWASPISFRLCR